MPAFPSRTMEHQRLLDLMRRVAFSLGLEGVSELAQRYDISDEAIYKWCRNEKVPVLWAKRFEQDTQGIVTREMCSPWAYH